MPLLIAKFPGEYLGGFAVVLAENESMAKIKVLAKLLEQYPELVRRKKIGNKDITFQDIPGTTDCHIIWNGDY